MSIVDIILDGRDESEWTPADDDLARELDPRVGSGSSLLDCSDPQTLALVVERNHDYPDPDSDWL